MNWFDWAEKISELESNAVWWNLSGNWLPKWMTGASRLMNEWIAVYEIAVGDWFNKFNSLPKWISFLDFNPANFKTTAIQHSSKTKIT